MSSTTEDVLPMPVDASTATIVEDVDPIPTARPSLKRQMASEERSVRPKGASPSKVHVDIRTPADATDMVLSTLSPRVFNGVDYVSFSCPIVVHVDNALAKTGVNRFGKILFEVDAESCKAIAATEQVVSGFVTGVVGTYDYMGLSIKGEQDTANTYRLKWNGVRGNKASVFIRKESAQREPEVSDSGRLCVEFSGYYYNRDTKVCGPISRVYSFHLLE